jgi:hypothetical protein
MFLFLLLLFSSLELLEESIVWIFEFEILRYAAILGLYRQSAVSTTT